MPQSAELRGIFDFLSECDGGYFSRSGGMGNSKEIDWKSPEGKFMKLKRAQKAIIESTRVQSVRYLATESLRWLEEIEREINETTVENCSDRKHD